MGAPLHNYGRWRRAILVPFWSLQVLFMLVFIVLLALALDVLSSEDTRIPDTSNKIVKTTVNIAIPVWISLAVTCLILTFAEIVYLIKHKLKPLFFLISNVIKSVIWTVLFVLDIISTADENGRTSTAFGIALAGILLVSLWIPLIYGSVVFHQYRKEQKSYIPVIDPQTMDDDGYPPQISELARHNHKDLESGPQRMTYSPQRDPSFESYKSSPRNVSYNKPFESPSGQGSPLMPVPELYVETHDGHIYDMGSRSELM